MTIIVIRKEKAKCAYSVNLVTSLERDNQTDSERPAALSQAPIPMRGKINQAERP